MKTYTRDLVLEGITEADFQNWKHHPVTKLVRRFQRDMERQLAEHQIAHLRNAQKGMSDLEQGEYKGTINTWKANAEIEYATIAEFYPSDDSQEDET